MTSTDPVAADPCRATIHASAVHLVIDRLRERGCDPRIIAPGTWIATCPACGAPDGLLIVIRGAQA